MNEEERTKKQIEQLKIYCRQGVHSAFTAMHFRSLQRRYPGVWDRLAFEKDKDTHKPIHRREVSRMDRGTHSLITASPLYTPSIS
jgi:hypothetical protein